MFNVNCKICSDFITEQSQEKTGGGGIISVAVMIDNKKFTYGLSGLLEFTDEFAQQNGLSKNDEICNNCLNKHTDKFQPAMTVECTCCHQLHQQISEFNTNDGWGCNSDVIKEHDESYLICGFGSSHDMQKFKVLVSQLQSTICDKCIDVMLAKKDIILIGSG